MCFIPVATDRRPVEEKFIATASAPGTRRTTSNTVIQWKNASAAAYHGGRRCHPWWSPLYVPGENMRTLLSCVVVVVLGSAAALADERDTLDVLPESLDGGPATSMLQRYLHAQAEQAFGRRKAAYEEIKTADDAAAYQRRVKEQLLAQLGPFPERTPLNVRVVGTIEGDGFRVENVVFESQPRHYVTANVYLPKGEPPYPGVVIPCGHNETGKAAQQSIAVCLARAGVAAMSYDPIGQGERHQLLDESGQPRFRPTAEHTLLGSTSILVGRNTATYRIWDGIRSIDYLAGRKDIDPNRIGVTGCSGGGTLSSYLMALDERIVCAAPSCYLTSFKRLLATIGPQDAEQNIYAQIGLGIDHADYILLRAPRPTLILASTHDFFDIEGTWDTFRQAKRFYTRLGYPERVELVETDYKHGYPQPQREAMVRWMCRWLKDDDRYRTEAEFEPYAPEQLFATPKGQVMLLDGARSVVDLNLELAEQFAPQRKQLWQAENRAAALGKVRELTGIRPLNQLPRPKVRSVETVQRDGHTVEKLVLEVEQGIVLPALLFRPEKVSASPCLCLHGLGKAAAVSDGPIDALLQEGRMVLSVDLRGTGETGVSEETTYGGNFKDIMTAYLLGRPMLTMRAEDVLISARYLAERDDAGGKQVDLVALAGAGPPALHAAALEAGLFAAVKLVDAPGSWIDHLRDPASPGQLVNTVHGALRYYDLADLKASLPGTQQQRKAGADQ